jgi:hypothetical protein
VQRVASIGLAADDVTTGLPLVAHTSMMWWHPAFSGGLINSDRKFLQPNFDPEGFINTVTKLTDV